MTNEKRNALKTVWFYVVALPLTVIINMSGAFKSGPCTPNLDVVSVLLLALLTILLLFINGFLAFGLERETKYSFFIHLGVFVIGLAFFLADR